MDVETTSAFILVYFGQVFESHILSLLRRYIRKPFFIHEHPSANPNLRQRIRLRLQQVSTFSGAACQNDEQSVESIFLAFRLLDVRFYQAIKPMQSKCCNKK